jgi:hypothetical protein
MWQYENSSRAWLRNWFPDSEQIVGSLAAGLVFTCSAANNFVYSKEATMEAAGAGHILLSIIQVCRLFGVRIGLRLVADGDTRC